jgi:excisionase family DNA binding protein
MTVVTSPERVREFLTVAQVAQLLRCSEPTVRRRIRDGSLPVVQLGGPGSAVRIPRSAFERSDQTTKGAPPHEL